MSVRDETTAQSSHLKISRDEQKPQEITRRVSREEDREVGRKGGRERKTGKEGKRER
jgi:hypothetical protein